MEEQMIEILEKLAEIKFSIRWGFISLAVLQVVTFYFLYTEKGK